VDRADGRKQAQIANPRARAALMAEVLYDSRNTVRTHLRSIYRKLGVESRSQAIERAVELRLL
jgi:DNA-binding CsgD family transcriptional regulator